VNRLLDVKAFTLHVMGSNPYEGFDTTGYSVDIAGWHSHHPLFESVISQLRPRLILEVGTWMGASAIHMAQLARRLEPGVQILCVDTWLGSHPVLWSTPEYRAQLRLKHGYPQQYFQFLANVVLSGLQDTIFPLPMTSYSATSLLVACGPQFDAIYIDAHHDEPEVTSDLQRCFEVLRPGGVMFGDDYSPGEPGVLKAVNRFVADRALYLTTAQEKWALQKPR